MHHTISKHAVSLVIGALLGIALYLYSPLLMRSGSDEPPPQFVAISEQLATSGQPSPAEAARPKSAAWRAMAVARFPAKTRPKWIGRRRTWPVTCQRTSLPQWLIRRYRVFYKNPLH